MVNHFYENQHRMFVYIKSHPHDFPQFQICNKFIDENECKKLTKYVLGHKLFGKTILNQGCFSSTRGFGIRFNKYSKHYFTNPDYNLKPICDIFEKIKQKGTNAYYFNSLVIKPKKYHDGNIIDYHYDDTLNIKDDNGLLYLPVCVTVIYIKVPKECNGGQLKLKEFGSTTNNLFGDEIRIKPKVGKKVVFRGDMMHAVNNIISEDEEDFRISLVFEQYNLPEDKLQECNFKIITKA